MKMLDTFRLAIAAFACAVGCAKAPASTPPTTQTPVANAERARTNVHVLGSIGDLQAGRIAGRSTLGGIGLGQHAFALGGLSDLRGEVTILDGVLWLAYPTGSEGVRVSRSEIGDQSITLLVYTEVSDWRESVLNEDVPLATLGARVQRLAADAGVTSPSRFPFVLEGHFSDVAWHAGKKPPGAGSAGTVNDATGTMLGFFSNEQGGLIVPQGANVHVHAVLEKQALSGHVDGAVVRSGTRVRLPLEGAGPR